jgi:hypothetical protein
MPEAECVVVTASRDWTDPRPTLKFVQDLPPGSEVIVGGAKGGDTLAEIYARQRGDLTVTVIQSDWDRYGISAGHIRNGWMLDRKPTRVRGFIRNQSRGASGCVTEAKRRGIPVEVTRDDRPKIRSQDVLWIDDGDDAP